MGISTSDGDREKESKDIATKKISTPTREVEEFNNGAGVCII